MLGSIRVKSPLPESVLEAKHLQASSIGCASVSTNEESLPDTPNGAEDQYSHCCAGHTYCH